MKWKPDSFTLVAGTEQGHLVRWQVDSGGNRAKSPLDAAGGATKISCTDQLALHSEVRVDKCSRK